MSKGGVHDAWVPESVHCEQCGQVMRCVKSPMPNKLRKFYCSLCDHTQMKRAKMTDRLADDRLENNQS